MIKQMNPVAQAYINAKRLLKLHGSVLTEEEKTKLKLTLENHQLAEQILTKSSDGLIDYVREIMGSIRKRGVE